MTSLDIVSAPVPASVHRSSRRSDRPVFSEVREARLERALSRMALVAGLVAVTATVLGALLLTR